MEILGTVVLIKPDKLPERTKSGALIIPQNSIEMLPEWGTLIDLGSECKVFTKGEHVYFPRRSSSLIVIDGIDHFITNEHRLLFGRKLKTNRNIKK